MKKKINVKNFTFIILIATMPLLAVPFTDNSDGTIVDANTGLVWQKCSRGQTADVTCSGTATIANWQTALAYCNALALASRTWRLPSINEIRTIIDRSKAVVPMIDTTAFPNTVAGNYSSASTNFTTPGFMHIIRFNNGNIEGKTKGTSLYVRCVSGP